MVIAALCIAAAAADSSKKDHSLRYDDTPFQPRREVARARRQPPRPPVVTPGAGRASPSDAIVLFDGTGPFQWVANLKGTLSEPKWKVENGYLEVVPGSGSLETREVRRHSVAH
jgi:hypothetical protein